MIKTREPSLFILLMLSSFASVTAVLFTPALPAMTTYFQITSGEAQAAVTLFLLGYAFGNLPYGPLSNRFGRKPTLYLGLSIAIVGSLLILGAGTLHLFWLVVIGRLIAGLGSSVGLKIAFTMIGDTSLAHHATKKMSYLILAFAIAPGLAIACGGFLTKQFGWMSCFYFLTGYSLLLLLLAFLLPETAQKLEPEALHLSNIKAGFLAKLKNKKIVLSALMMGCSTSCIYLFASEAPFIGIEKIGLPPDIYGLLNFIPPLGMIIGSFISLRLVGKKEVLTIFLIGMTIGLAATLIMFLLFLLGSLNLYTLFLPMPIIYMGFSLVYSNASSLAMSSARNKSNASAIVNFLNMGFSMVSLFVMGFLPSDKAFILPLFFLVLTLLMFVFRFFLMRIKT